MPDDPQGQLLAIIHVHYFLEYHDTVLRASRQWFPSFEYCELSLFRRNNCKETSFLFDVTVKHNLNYDM